MKIVVFGASGKTGLHLIKQALDNQHEVIAYVRRDNAIGLEHKNLKIVVGNLSDVSKISETIKGSDACISALGGNSLRKHAIDFMNGISNIIKAMETNGVNRFIYLSSIGAGESRLYMSQPIRFLIVDLMLKIPLADHTKNEEAIKTSKLQWTIVRPGGLNDTPLSDKELSHGHEAIVLKGNPSISRANVASFMLAQLSHDTYLNKSAWLHQ